MNLGDLADKYNVKARVLLFAIATLGCSHLAAAGEAVSLEFALLPGESELVHVDLSWNETRSLSKADFANIKKAQALGAGPVQFFEVEEDEVDRSPSEESALERAKSQAAENGVEFEVYQQPKEVNRGLKAWIKQFNSQAAALFVRPSREILAVGTAMVVYRGVTSTMIWTGADGVSAVQAAGLIALQMSLSAVHSFYGMAADTLFSKRFPGLKLDISPRSQFFRRQIYSLFWAETMKVMALGGAAFTLDSQLTVLQYLLTVGTGDAIFSSVRTDAYGSKGVDYNASQSVSVLGFLILSPIQLMSFAGTAERIVVSLSFFEMKFSTAMMLGSYAVLIGAIKVAPKLVENIAAIPERVVLFGRKAVTSFRVKLRAACSTLLKPPMPPLPQ